MKPLLLCARLVLCDTCGLHGYIVFSDGSKSEEFYFKEDVENAIVKAYVSGKVNAEEAKFLRRALYESGMFRSDSPIAFVIVMRRLHPEKFPQPKKSGSPRTLH